MSTRKATTPSKNSAFCVAPNAVHDIIRHLNLTINIKSFYALVVITPTKEEVNVFARDCLLAGLLKNACIDFEEMLLVDRCWDMDELINF